MAVKTKVSTKSAIKDWAKNLAMELALLVPDEDIHWVANQQPQEVNLNNGEEIKLD